jgi:VanZ family protein
MPDVIGWVKSIPMLGKFKAFYQNRVPGLTKRWGLALLLMMIIFAFSSIPSKEMPDFGVYDLSVKKLGHAMGYAFLALAYLKGLGGRKRKTFLLAWLMAVFYAMTDEFHQSFVPGRGSTIIDVGIDSVGAGLGLLLFALFAKL